MEEKLNQAQNEAINHPAGPLLMAAGAGSGKTKALTGRLKALIARGVPGGQIVAITFTNKAADEMRARVFGKDAQKPAWNAPLPTPGSPFIGTFHSLGARILKQELRYSGRTPGFTIFDADDSLNLIKKILKDMDLPKDRFRPPAVSNRLSDIKGELENPNDLLESGNDYDQIIFHIFDRYEKELGKNNAFDFDDLIEKPVRLFRRYPEILKKYQESFLHILVDEYQDINAAQYQLVRLLAQQHGNVSVVGDDAQAIYSFRGADFRNFLNFGRDWPNAKIIKLEQNYRSTKNILAAANAVIGHNKLQTPKNLWTENESGERIRLVAADDPDTEAVWVASEIRTIYEINPHAQIAVLYRTNAQSRSIEQALISENLPYKIFGGLKFYERKEIKDVIAGLRLALNPADTVSRERLEKALGKRGSEEILRAIPGLSEKLTILELISFFLDKTKYKEHLETKFANPQERLENVQELIGFAAQFSTLAEFLERVSLLQSSDVPSTEALRRLERKNGPITPVHLMTIHIAKGLEFEHVFVIGVNEGVLPHEKAMLRDEEVEEERRLMYVAMTRARKVLYLLFHAFPSRFLYEIPNELFEFISPSGMRDRMPNDDEMWIEN